MEIKLYDLCAYAYDILTILTVINSEDIIDLSYDNDLKSDGTLSFKLSNDKYKQLYANGFNMRYFAIIEHGSEMFLYFSQEVILEDDGYAELRFIGLREYLDLYIISNPFFFEVNRVSLSERFWKYGTIQIGGMTMEELLKNLFSLAVLQRRMEVQDYPSSRTFTPFRVSEIGNSYTEKNVTYTIRSYEGKSLLSCIEEFEKEFGVSVKFNVSLKDYYRQQSLVFVVKIGELPIIIPRITYEYNEIPEEIEGITGRAFDTNEETQGGEIRKYLLTSENKTLKLEISTSEAIYSSKVKSEETAYEVASLSSFEGKLSCFEGSLPTLKIGETYALGNLYESETIGICTKIECSDDIITYSFTGFASAYGVTPPSSEVQRMIYNKLNRKVKEGKNNGDFVYWGDDL